MLWLHTYLMQDNRFMSLIGIVTILGIAFIFSNNRRKISWRLVVNALLMQFALAFFILKTSFGQNKVQTIASGFNRLYEFANAGTEFVFGRLADPSGPWMMIFAIKVVPIIIFFGALMSLLFHLGIIQILVKVVSFAIRPLLGTSGAETLCAAANSMLGQTEAPLLVKNYLKSMTKSEMLVVMVSGMGTLSGAILAVYGSMGVPMNHLLTASVMAIPGSILVAKILIPETEIPETSGGRTIEVKSSSKNVLDAISTGTIDGMHLAANVVAMLIAFISLIAMVNFLLELGSGYFNGAAGAFTLNDVFAKIFAPLAAALGVSRGDVATAGKLIGQKFVINEFVAYASFVKETVTPRTAAIITYALAGFSNFSCIGIQIGGIGALAPDKRMLLTRLGLTALIGGTLTNLLNAAIAGLLL